MPGRVLALQVLEPLTIEQSRSRFCRLPSRRESVIESQTLCHAFLGFDSESSVLRAPGRMHIMANICIVDAPFIEIKCHLMRVYVGDLSARMAFFMIENN